MNELAKLVRTRSGALGILATASALVVILALVFINTLFRTTRAEQKSALQQLALYRAEISQAPELKSELHIMLNRLADNPATVSGANPSLAAAKLDNDVKTLVQANGGAIRSSQIMPPDKEAGFQVIAINYDLSVPMSKLKQVLYVLETHTPFLFIDDATITSPLSFDSSEGAIRDRSLEIRWKIRGYRWIGRE